MSAKSSARRNSVLTAAAIAIALTVWIMSGAVVGTPGPAVRDHIASDLDTPVAVRVVRSTASETLRTIVASARTEPDRWLELKAETEGRVVAINAERGARVATNQSLIEIDLRDRRSRLSETEALIRQRELEYEAGEKLLGERFISPADLAARAAALESARAARERILLDIAHTTIRAPFAAIVFDRLVEIGDYVAAGDTVAQLIDTDPLIVVADINEREIGTISIGSTGIARLRDGRKIEGRIRYVAPAADEATRSFRVELAIENSDFELGVGTSAQIELGAETIFAHRLAPSVLWLADNGDIGVKTVDESNRVRFVPIEIADSTAESLLVTGLPRTATVIVQGQGFVIDGQAVTTSE